MKSSLREGSSASEGLGFSLALYFALMAGGLALFVAPVYYFNAPEVHANPGLAAYEPPPLARVIRPASGDGPFARLAPAAQPDAALQAFASENVRKLTGGRGAVARRTAETTGSSVSERADDEPPRRSRPAALQSLDRRMSTVF